MSCFWLFYQEIFQLAIDKMLWPMINVYSHCDMAGDLWMVTAVLWHNKYGHSDDSLWMALNTMGCFNMMLSVTLLLVSFWPLLCGLPSYDVVWAWWFWLASKRFDVSSIMMVLVFSSLIWPTCLLAPPVEVGIPEDFCNNKANSCFTFPP